MSSGEEKSIALQELRDVISRDLQTRRPRSQKRNRLLAVRKHRAGTAQERQHGGNLPDGLRAFRGAISDEIQDGS